MKKIILAVLALVIMSASSFAQNKKDGTPDMRYKANKEKKVEKAEHTKKDGTPDKRYKENKETKPAEKAKKDAVKKEESKKK
ncbi:MAG: hypothetical protein JSS64_10245 [Bacteroidetes bacterium]|nr:hypothetical protein [Bacteroidota bacterium]